MFKFFSEKNPVTHSGIYVFINYAQFYLYIVFVNFMQGRLLIYVEVKSFNGIKYGE